MLTVLEGIRRVWWSEEIRGQNDNPSTACGQKVGEPRATDMTPAVCATTARTEKYRGVTEGRAMGLIVFVWLRSLIDKRTMGSAEFEPATSAV